jgi:hypothetical protein
MDVLLSSSERDTGDFRDALWNAGHSSRAGIGFHVQTCRFICSLLGVYITHGPSLEEAMWMLSEQIPPEWTGRPIILDCEMRQRILLHMDACVNNFVDFILRYQVLGDGRRERPRSDSQIFLFKMESTKRKKRYASQY